MSIKFARPLAAPTQNLHNIASAIFCGPKQVIRIAQIQEVEKPVLPLDGIAAKKETMAIFGFSYNRQCNSMPVLQSLLIRDLMRMSFLQNVSFNRIP